MILLPLLIAQTLIVPISGSTNSHATVPGDFSLRLEFGICTTDVIDTFKGEYVRDLGNGETISTRVSLSKTQTAKLYDLVNQAGFFDYPLVFRPQGSAGFEPHDHYRLEVRNGGATHSVSWDEGDSTSSDAQRFRDLLRGVIRVFSEMPAVRALPHAKVLCL